MLSYLLEDDVQKIRIDLRKLIEDAHAKDVGFQFWELFLNSGVRRVHDDPRQQSSHDRLLLSYHTISQKESKPKIDTTNRILEDEKDTHIKSYTDILIDIRYLHSMCFAYQMNTGSPGETCFTYESFRFFVVNTLVNYFIDHEAFGFESNGVSKFFDALILRNPSLRAATRDKLIGASNQKDVPKSVKTELESEYFDASGMKIDEYLHDAGGRRTDDIANKASDRYKVREFLKSVAHNADSISGLVIANFGDMSLSCMRIFFNDSTNVYLPWMPSGSSGFFAKNGGEATFVYPANELNAYKGQIFHSINWRSYSAYNKIAANRSPLAGGKRGPNPTPEADHLGVMLRWPILQKITHSGPDSGGIFQISGFLRMMRRYSISHQELIEPDQYTSTVWDADKAVLTPMIRKLSSNIGLYLSFRD